MQSPYRVAGVHAPNVRFSVPPVVIIDRTDKVGETGTADGPGSTEHLGWSTRSSSTTCSILIHSGRNDDNRDVAVSRYS